MKDSSMFFRRSSTVLAAVLLVAVAGGPARASSDVSGRWDSNSLRDNRIGYYLILKSSGATDNQYSGIIRFAYRDGRKGPRMPFVASINGDELAMSARQGRFDRGRGVLRGKFSRDGSSLTLTNCQDRLRLVMPRALDSDCVFAPAKVN
jgi:hypothetical protein